MQDFKALLRAQGYRATPGRIAILRALWQEGEPITVAALKKRLRSLDTVTLYRALEAFVVSGLIRRVDLGHAHTHYEMEKKHHHHLVCNNCGLVEDIEDCKVGEVESKLLKHSRRFKSIYSHNLEFFGSCKSCAA